LIQIAPGGKGAAGQKVVFDEGKRTFHARRAVRVADLVRIPRHENYHSERMKIIVPMRSRLTIPG
jgi:hypothetical protein